MIGRHDHVAQDQVDGLVAALAAANAAAAAALAAANAQWTTGDFKQSGSTAAQTGWLLCDGTTVSQTTYAALFAKIGTTYNTGGEAAGTFRLPNFANKFPRGNTPGAGGGADTHTHTSSAHSHTLSDAGQAQVGVSSNSLAVFFRNVPTTAFNETVRAVTTAGSPATGQTRAAGLAGSTDSATAPDTGSSSNVPAYTGVAVFIKT